MAFGNIPFGKDEEASKTSKTFQPRRLSFLPLKEIRYNIATFYLHDIHTWLNVRNSLVGDKLFAFFDNQRATVERSRTLKESLILAESRPFMVN